MKITTAGRAARAGSKRQVGGAGQDRAGGGFAVTDGGGALRQGPAISPAAPLAALGGVLAVQEVADRSAERRRAIAWGEGLLDELAALRTGLLDGQVAPASLRRLGQLLDATRTPLDDTALSAVLDAIEIRAAVELAKLERSRPPPGAPGAAGDETARDETWPILSHGP